MDNTATIIAFEKLGFKRINKAAPFLTFRKGRDYDVLVVDGLVRIWQTVKGEFIPVYTNPVYTDENQIIQEVKTALNGE